MDIVEENIKETKKYIESISKVRVYPYVADLSKTDMINKYVDEVIDRFGKIDILINNAGIQERKPALEFSLEDWNKVITIHLTVTFLMSKYIAHEMIKNGGGKIINLASLNSSIAVPNIIAYTSAKSGIAGLTRSMAAEWSKYNIRVNAIAPGFCRTALTGKLFQKKKKEEWVMGRIPLKRLADPEDDLGYVEVFLASEASRYIIGQVIYTDGGWLIS